MSGQFRPYEPEFEKLSSPASNSPLTPNPRGGTPVSFRPNVNRAKTKRWVEAKKYSYDGNDWGDDDYDEYDDAEDEPAPQSAGPSLKAIPPVPPILDNRSRSMDHVLTLGGDGSKGNRSLSADRSVQGISSKDSKPVPIVRPADIYQRMRDERAGRRQSRIGDSISGVPSQDLPTVGQPATDPVSQSVPGHETSGNDDHGPHRPLQETNNEGGPQGSSIPSTAPQNTPVIKLPDVKRLSGFNADFLGESSSPNPGSQDPESQQSQLQHNPSLGFRSAVHQAFDVPETPSTTVDSVGRSNSDSTSVVSPIIPNRGLSDEKTPTIAEEPGETSTPKATPERNSIIFKPGHRRDFSLPSPGNSPSRKPQVTDNDQIPPSSLAEVSSVTPADVPQDPLSYLPSSEESSRDMPAKEMPPPLRVSSPVAGSPSGHHVSSDLPVLIPSMITDNSSPDNSPQDTENDRLRKEIIRSLSRENTPSDEPESRPMTRQDDSLIPSEYERYWSDETNLSPHNKPRPSVPEYNPSPPASRGLGSPSPLASPPASGQDTRPKLKKRFSWESSTSSDEHTPVPELASQPPVPYISTETENSNASELSAPEGEQREVERPEKPKLTIIPPSTADTNSVTSGQFLPEVYNAQVVQQSGEAQSPSIPQQASPSVRAAPVSVEPTLLGFRDILGIQSSDERTKAFNRTRDQFGTIDTGLSQWIQVTVHGHPEHVDVVDRSQKLGAGAPKMAVSKSKFPKLPSLGNFGSSHPEGAPSGSGHVRRPSAPLGSIMHKQQVEQRGKDLLHTAGVLGGRAGEAAKGLFARGRSKLKSGGGNDKESESMRGPRKSLLSSPLPIKDDRDRSTQRSSGYFGSLPLMKTSRIVDAPPRLSLDAKRLPVVPEASPSSPYGSRGGSIHHARAVSVDDVTQLRKLVDKRKPVNQPKKSSLSTETIQNTHGEFSNDLKRTDNDRGSYALDLEREIVAALRLDEGEFDYVSRESSAVRGPEKASRLSVDYAYRTTSATTNTSASHRTGEVVTGANDDGRSVGKHSRLSFSDFRTSALAVNRRPDSSRRPSSQFLGLDHDERSLLTAPVHVDQADSGTALCAATGPANINVNRSHLALNDEPLLISSGREKNHPSRNDTDEKKLKTPAECVDCEDSEGAVSESHDTPPPEERLNDARVISTKSSQPTMQQHFDAQMDLPNKDSNSNLPKARDFQAANIPGSSNAPLTERGRGHYRRGSETPLQLHQLPSISSLGAQDASTLGRQYPNIDLAWGLAQGNHSVVSLPSEYSEGHYRSLSDPPRSMDGALAPGHGGASVSAPGSAHGRHSPLRGYEAGNSNSTGTRSSFNDFLSQPNSDSFGSTKVNAATSGNDLSDAGAWGPAEKESSAHKRLSAMRKLKNVGKLPHLSRAVQHRRAFSRLSGLFGRSNAPIPPTDQHQQQQSSIQTQTQNPLEVIQHSRRSSEQPPSFRGQPPPPKGYFAPDSLDTFIGGHKLTGQQHPRIDENPNPTSSSTTINNTTSNNNTITTMPPPLTSQSYFPTYYNNRQPPNQYTPRTTTSPIPPLPSTPPSRGRTSGRTYAQDLHLRSRSPKFFAPSPEEKTIPSSDFTDPAYNLGTFRSNPRTSRLGDQELPWKITIPGEQEAGAPSSSQNGQSLSTVEESNMDMAGHPHRGQGRAINSVRSPVELPVAEDDSSDEIVMSSTAYPGQEWRPLGLAGWQHF